MDISVVILPERSWEQAAGRWRRAEELGFSTAWTYDHLTWRSFRDAPWFAAVPTLVAAATVTTELRLGTLVASPNFRHPVAFAKELVALDDISGGRITLGLGAGGSGWDTTMLGDPPWSAAERAERFAEFVELTDRLLRSPATSWSGRYYAADEARMHPGCVQSPRLPFAVAATGPRGMRLAARFAETWVTNGPRGAGEPLDAARGAELVATQLRRVEAACAEEGRDPSTLRRLVLTGLSLQAGLGSLEQFRDTVGEYEAVGVTDLAVHWPREEDPFATDPAVLEAVAAEFCARG